MKHNQLFSYYAEELSYFRKEGKKFADKYPHIASKLGLSRDVSPDPDTERLIESVAFLTARIRRNINDQFYDFINLLLDMTFPEIGKFTPSRTILHCQPTQLSDKFPYRIPRNKIFEAHHKDYSHIKFTSVYDTDIYPFKVEDTRHVPVSGLLHLKASDHVDGAIKISLSSPDSVPISACAGNKLRFYIDHDAQTAHYLYELIQRSDYICVTADDEAILPTKVEKVGFADDETTLPYMRGTYSPQLLVYEYFAFHEKFLFFDIEIPADFQNAAANEMHIYITFQDILPRDVIQRILSRVDKSAFVLNAVPVVNLFPKMSEPIRVNRRNHEYPVVCDYRTDGGEYLIYDIISATLVKQSPEGQSVKPVSSLYHAYPHLEKSCDFWVARKELSDTAPYNFFISLLDNETIDSLATEDVLSLKLLCANDNESIQSFYRNSTGASDLSYEGKENLDIRFLRAPHNLIMPVQNPETLWKIVSQQSFNRQGFFSHSEDPHDALVKALHLYNPHSPQSAFEYERVNSFITGVKELNIQSEMRRFGTLGQKSFCRGSFIHALFDENKFTGGGVYLFSDILARFINAYTSINSYTRFTAGSVQRKKDIAQWPAQAGGKPLM